VSDSFPFNQIVQGHARDVLQELPSQSVDMVITSPPYWALRDYGVAGQIGHEPTVEGYILALTEVFDQAKRVLKDHGTCWVNLGDTYGTGSGAGVRAGKQATNRGTQSNVGWQRHGKAGVAGFEKCLLQIPSRFALDMAARGWRLRNEIIWHKPNVMPSSAADRFTVDFEKLFFFVKQPQYYFRQQFERLAPGTAFKGRNRRSVWSIPTRPFLEAHFAVFPEALIETPILAGCPEGGVVLDPFIGSGTTALVALRLRRRFVGIELNPAYVDLARQRIVDLVHQTALAA
jgi:site-specific DNA-methyltransferase (cytosine-N4-specific)